MEKKDIIKLIRKYSKGTSILFGEGLPEGAPSNCNSVYEDTLTGNKYKWNSTLNTWELKSESSVSSLGSLIYNETETVIGEINSQPLYGISFDTSLAYIGGSGIEINFPESLSGAVDYITSVIIIMDNIDGNAITYIASYIKYEHLEEDYFYIEIPDKVFEQEDPRESKVLLQYTKIEDLES